VHQAKALAADRTSIRALGGRARQTAEALAWGRVVGQFEALLLAVAGAQSEPLGAALFDAVAGGGIRS
jgi:hypothetical protein